MNERTDLALESHELHTSRAGSSLEGITIDEQTVGAIRCTDISVTSAQAAQQLGRPVGRYITMEFGRFWEGGEEELEEIAIFTASKLRSLLPYPHQKEKACVLVAGLGNRAITADALGPAVADALTITRHIRGESGDVCASAVAATAPGVLAQTGIESAEIVEAVAGRIKPDLVIVVDALASREPRRLASTIQLSDTGISPGSGVGNHRTALNRQTLGVPVISIGMPTVVDVAVLVSGIGREMGLSGLERGDVARYLRSEDLEFFVTPRDADVIVETGAKLLARVVDLAFMGK